MAVKLIQYIPTNVCCKNMQILIEDGKIVQSIFIGGCNGNLRAISNFIKGMSIDEVIEKLKGIPCGSKNTSCPDQLAKCLLDYKKELEHENN